VKNKDRRTDKERNRDSGRGNEITKEKEGNK
jgi:hypothetical protein